MNIWVRIVGTAVACLTLLGVAVRASSSISGERDRQTWDSLLITPLSSDSMLIAKWLGSVCSVRWGWLWLGIIWGLGVVSGGVHVLAVPLLLGTWMVYAGVLALVGLWYSMTCRTTLQSTVGTLLTTLVAGGGHWLLWMCCLPLAFFRTGSGDFFDFLAKTELGLTPPFVLGLFAFRGEELGYTRSRDLAELIAYTVAGLVLWSMAGVGLWYTSRHRFRQVTGRSPLGRARHLALSHRPRPKPLPVAETPVTPADSTLRDDTGFDPHERQP